MFYTRLTAKEKKKHYSTMTTDEKVEFLSVLFLVQQCNESKLSSTAVTIRRVLGVSYYYMSDGQDEKCSTVTPDKNATRA